MDMYQDGGYKPSLTPPLQIMQYTHRGKTHIHVSRGAEVLVIVLFNKDWSAVQVNGVDVVFEQGRKFLSNLLGQSPEKEFPRIGVRDIRTDKVSYELEAEVSCMWNAGLAELTKEVMEADLTLRRLMPDERDSMIATANYIESAFR